MKRAYAPRRDLTYRQRVVLELMGPKDLGAAAVEVDRGAGVFERELGWPAGTVSLVVYSLEAREYVAKVDTPEKKVWIITVAGFEALEEARRTAGVRHAEMTPGV